MAKSAQPPDLLPGTLDLLILRTLMRGEMHGYAIAQHLKTASEDVLQVGESSLYPALQRLLLNGWVKAEWGASENNRRARYYTLTAAGKKRLFAERQEFETHVASCPACRSGLVCSASAACRRSGCNCSWPWAATPRSACTRSIPARNTGAICATRARFCACPSATRSNNPFSMCRSRSWPR